MDNDKGSKVDRLIKELQLLQIERERIGAEERAIVQRIQLARLGTDSGEAQANQQPSQPSTTGVESFTVGQKVYILNRIGHLPFTKRPSPKDRAGVVTRITKTRVYITTYNGSETWRAPSNIKRLTLAEHESIVNGQKS